MFIVNLPSINSKVISIFQHLKQSPVFVVSASLVHFLPCVRLCCFDSLLYIPYVPLSLNLINKSGLSNMMNVVYFGFV